MAFLYILEQNTILRKTGNRLILCKRPPVNRHTSGVRESDILAEWPCTDVEHVMVFGNIQITTQAMHHLLEHGIEIALLTRNGELVGQLTPPCGKNVFLRVRQYEKYTNAEFRSWFSKQIVLGKIQNALGFLKAYSKNHPDALDRTDLENLEKTGGQSLEARSVGSLLGYEGVASATYFKLLSALLPEEWRFTHRSRRPPKDSANAVLSFGYTILANEITSLLDGVGLDPALGFYHELDYGRPSLALDLLEIFRHVFIDRLMVSLFNLRVLSEEDFFVLASNQGVYLNEAGKRKFFQQYERMMGSYAQTAETGSEEAGYRKIIQSQVNELVHAIKEDAIFRPYKL